jgi:hypothetical protein
MRWLFALCVLCAPAPVWAAIDCDSTDDYVSIPDQAANDFSDTTGGSWGAWVNLDSGAEHAIIDKRGDQFENGYSVRVNDATSPYTIDCIVHTGAGGGWGEYLATATNAVTVSTWTHIGCVFNDAAATLKIYINGSVVTTTTSVSVESPPDNDDAVVLCDLGAFGNTPPTTYNLDGRIDDPYFTQQVLTDQDMANLASRVKRIPLLFSPGFYYPLMDCAEGVACSTSAGAIKDESQNQNHGTAYGAGGAPVGKGSQILSYP